jgi:hypothetical protein
MTISVLPEVTCLIIQHLPSFRDRASLALTAQVFSWIIRDQKIVWEANPPVILDGTRSMSMICPMPNGQGFPEPKLGFLLKLAQKAHEFAFRSEEHKQIINVIFDELLELFPSKLFPAQKPDRVIQAIFKELENNIDTNRPYSSPLGDKIVAFRMTLSSIQKIRFVTVLPLNQLRLTTKNGLREICIRFHEQKNSKTEGWQKSFVDYFTCFNFRVWGALYDGGAPLFAWVISPQYLEFYLDQQPKEESRLNRETIKAFNSLPSTKDTYDKLKVLAAWYSKRSFSYYSNRWDHLLVILSIANNLMKKQGPLGAQLRSRELHGSRTNTFFLTLAEVQSWIPKVLSSWEAFVDGGSLKKKDLELQRLFTKDAL